MSELGLPCNSNIPLGAAQHQGTDLSAHGCEQAPTVSKGVFMLPPPCREGKGCITDGEAHTHK